MKPSIEQLIIHRVLKEAWHNPTFKAQLLEDPIPAIHQLTGIQVKLPPGKRLAVYDQSNTEIICLNIPPQPDSLAQMPTDEASSLDDLLRKNWAGSNTDLWQQLYRRNPPTTN